MKSMKEREMEQVFKLLRKWIQSKYSLLYGVQEMLIWLAVRCAANYVHLKQQHILKLEQKKLVWTWEVEQLNGIKKYI